MNTCHRFQLRRAWLPAPFTVGFARSNIPPKMAQPMEWFLHRLILDWPSNHHPIPTSPFSSRITRRTTREVYASNSRRSFRCSSRCFFFTSSFSSSNTLFKPSCNGSCSIEIAFLAGTVLLFGNRCSTWWNERVGSRYVGVNSFVPLSRRSQQGFNKGNSPKAVTLTTCGLSLQHKLLWRPSCTSMEVIGI